MVAKWGGRLAHEVSGTGAPDLVGTLGGTTLQQEARVCFKSHSGCYGEYRWNRREPVSLDDLNHCCEEG